MEKSIYISSFEEYIRLISFIYSKDNSLTHIRINEPDFAKIELILNSHNIKLSKFYALFLSSFLFTSGTFRIRIKDFLSYFMSDNKLDYSYQLVITHDIYKLYTNICRKQTNLPFSSLIRAALFYYQNIAPDDLHITESKSVTVTNDTTGWKKFFIRGSLTFKDYLFELKQKTGKTINCIANNATYQFLSAMRNTA
jgi:hypothetical protein